MAHAPCTRHNLHHLEFRWAIPRVHIFHPHAGTSGNYTSDFPDWCIVLSSICIFHSADSRLSAWFTPELCAAIRAISVRFCQCRAVVLIYARFAITAKSCIVRTLHESAHNVRRRSQGFWVDSRCIVHQSAPILCAALICLVLAALISAPAQVRQGWYFICVDQPHGSPSVPFHFQEIF